MKPSVRENILPYPVCSVCPWRLIARGFTPLQKMIAGSFSRPKPGRRFYYIKEQKQFQLEHEKKRIQFRGPFS